MITWRGGKELRRALSRHARQHEQGGGGQQAVLQAQLQHRLPFRTEPYTLALHCPPPPPPAQPGSGEAPEPRTPRQRQGDAAAGGGAGGMEAAAAGSWPPVAPSLDLRDAPHRLQQWFGLQPFLLLSPDSYSGRVLEAEVRWQPGPVPT